MDTAPQAPPYVAIFIRSKSSSAFLGNQSETSEADLPPSLPSPSSLLHAFPIAASPTASLEESWAYLKDGMDLIMGE